MAKYDPLRDHLAGRAGTEVRMSFDEVEELVGLLPPSARTHRAWWANDSKVEALAWRAAGWRVESVDQSRGMVLFVRSTDNGPPRNARTTTSVRRSTYVDADVVAKIEASALSAGFDHTKLVQLIRELNDNYSRGNAYAAHALLRAILDHVPPIFGCTDFRGVANNYQWSRTDKNYMRKLLDFKLQADDVLHRQISRRADLISLEDMPPRTWLNHLLQECTDPERPRQHGECRATGHRRAFYAADISTLPAPHIIFDSGSAMRSRPLNLGEAMPADVLGDETGPLRSLHHRFKIRKWTRLANISSRQALREDAMLGVNLKEIQSVRVR
jgi:hypothetical protein